PVHIRSFISAGSTGAGMFRGDGRGPSTLDYPQAWSRVKTSFTVDPLAGTITNRNTDSDPTVFYGAGNPFVGPYFPPDAQTPEPSANISNEVTYNNAISF